MDRAKELRSYLIGFGLSVVLTAIPFVLVATRPNHALVWIIVVCAVVQAIVHLRFFLHLRLHGQQRDDLQLVLFTMLILFFMIGGTTWILTNLAGRMESTQMLTDQ